ncbi:Gfo/Idh/MocA family oxidoreductase [Deinococcus malanensis]|uniref:Gfo/Idh/MocA family oxidoreductase n=1 Tax=Deinococcus malanensis TaxID=1706855 RepID=UPI0036268127
MCSVPPRHDIRGGGRHHLPLRRAGTSCTGVMAFLEAIRGDREVVCTGEDGLEAVRLIQASYTSARLGQPVLMTQDRAESGTGPAV